MATQTIEQLVEGGKATAAPPLGPALGPLGVNIGQVVAEINKKTESFKGMQVPVKVIVDGDTKEFSIGRFMKEHPEHHGNVTDLLIGRVFQEGAGAVFQDMDASIERAKMQEMES